MFKKSKLTKLVKRHGAKTVKTLFRIRVLQVSFPQTSKDIVAGAEIGVCFERGGKISSSRDVTVNPADDGSVQLHFEEDTLSLVVTMYKDEDQFQQKIGNIVVRQKKKNVMGSDSFKGLGLASFSLDSIANSYAPVELTLPVGQCAISGATVTIHVTPKFIGEVDGTLDETMSMQSGFSGNNEIHAADFGSNAGDEESLDPDIVEVDTVAENTTSSAVTADISTINEMRLEIATLSQKLIDMTSNYNSVCDENDRQKVALHESRNDSHKAEERAEEMSEQISSLEDKLIIQEGDIRELTVSLDNFKARTQELLTGKAELKLKLDQAEETCESSRGEAKELRDRVEELTREVSEWEKRQTSMDAEMASVEATNVRLSSMVSQLQEDVEAKEEQCSVLVRENDSQQAELSDVKIASAAQCDTIASQEKQLDELEASLRSSNVHAEVLQEEVECLRSERSVQANALLAAEQRVSELCASLAEAVEAKATVDAELASVRGEAVAQASTIAEQQQRIMALSSSEDMLATIGKELESLRESEILHKDLIHDYTCRLQDLEQTLAASTMRNTTYEDDIRELTVSLDNFKARTQELLTGKAELKLKLDQAEETCESSRGEAKELRDRVEELTREVSEWEKRQTSMDAEMASVEATNVRLSSMVSQLHEDVEAKEEQCSVLNSCLLNQKVEMESLLQKSQEVSEEEIANASNRIVQLKDELGVLRSTISRSGEELCAEENRAKELEEKLRNSQDDLELQRNHNVELNETIKELESQLVRDNSEAEIVAALLSSRAHLEEEMAILRASTESSLEVRRGIESDLRSCQAQIEKQDRDRLHLQSQHVDEVSRLECQMSDLSDRVAELEADVAAKSAHIAELMASEATLSSANTALREEVTERNRCCDNLVSEKADVERALMSLERDKEALQSERTANIDMIYQLESEIVELKSRIAELESHDLKRIEEIAALEAQRVEMRADIEQRASLVDECEAAAESLRTDTLHMRSVLDAREVECARLTAIADDLEGKIILLSSSYDDLLDKKRAVQQDLTRVTEELHVLTGEHSKCASLSSELLNRYMEAEARAHDAKATLSALDDEVSTLRGQNHTLKEQVRELEDKWDSALAKDGIMTSSASVTAPAELFNRCMEAEAKAHEAKAALSELDEEMLSLRGQNGVLNEQTRELEAELDKHKDRVSTLKRRLRVYAQRVTELEVIAAETHEKREEQQSIVKTETQFVRRMLI